MSVSGEVNITIQMPATAGGETGTADGSAPSPASPKQETNTSADPVGGDSNGQVKLSAALQAAKGVGTQIINASVSSIGLATGNYYKQKKTERAMQVGGQLVGLAVSAFTNPLALVASISTIAISSAAEYYQQNRERDIENYKTEQYAKRLGYTRDRK